MTDEQLLALAADYARDEARELRMIGIEVTKEDEEALRDRWLKKVKNAKG